MAFQIKQIYFLVSKKAAARKQKRYDTGYALTANKLHSGRTDGFSQRSTAAASPRSGRPISTHSAASHICNNPPEQMEKRGAHGNVTPSYALCRHRLIFPGSFPPSIVSAGELNYRVRNGNGWILSAIGTG